MSPHFEDQVIVVLSVKCKWTRRLGTVYWSTHRTVSCSSVNSNLIEQVGLVEKNSVKIENLLKRGSKCQIFDLSTTTETTRFYGEALTLVATRSRSSRDAVKLRYTVVWTGREKDGSGRLLAARSTTPTR